MDKNTCKEIRIEMAKAFKAVEKKFGVNVELGNMTYGADEIRTKMTVRTVGSLNQFQKNYDDMVEIDNNLPKRGSQLSDGTVVYGWNTRARKFPVIIEKVNGKQYKISKNKLLNSI